MTKTEAARAICEATTGEISTKMFEDMGWPLEAFIRWAQLPEELATTNLQQTQAALREIYALDNP